MKVKARATPTRAHEVGNLMLSGSGRGFVKNLGRSRYVSNSANEQRVVASWLDADVCIVDVDISLPKAVCNACQFARPMCKPGLRYLVFSESHALTIQDRLGGRGIVRDEADGALALIRKRLERDDVHSFVR